jgi:hypothetical protein
MKNKNANKYKLVKKEHGKFWFEGKKLHREDGPAVILNNGDQYWYKNDKRHREDGPAIIYKNGKQEWYINGRKQYQSQSSDT